MTAAPTGSRTSRLPACLNHRPTPSLSSGHLSRPWRRSCSGAKVPPIALIHVDCDIFSAATTVLETLDRRIGPGTVIVFDELLNYAEFPENELLALYLFLRARNLDFEWFVTIGDLYPFEQACAGKQPDDAFVGYRNLCCYQNTSIVITASTGSLNRIEKFMPLARSLARQRPLQRSMPAD